MFAISFMLTNAGSGGWIAAYSGTYEKSLRRSSSSAARSIAQVTRKRPAPPLLPRPPNCGTVKHKDPGAMTILSCERSGILSLLSCLFCLCAFPARAQEEIVANLAAGRLVIDVARDGNVIGSIEQRIEADSRPPPVFPP